MPTLRSSRVVLPEGERPATIRFEDGRIVEVRDGPADYDFGDLVVLSGLVDAHVHVNEPGRTEWEGFATATAAALAGGTTTLVDMPLNSIPPTVDVSALRAKQDAARNRVTADVAFWGGVIPGSEAEVPRLVDEGVCGFKVFMVDSGVDEFPPLSPDAMADVARRVAFTGVPLLVHAEDPDHLVPPDGDPRDYSTYLATRPGSAEAAAIEAVTRLAGSSGVHAHILHVSGAEAVGALSRATAPVTAETCPHYLTFDADAIPEGATAFKCAPPIRRREDREALWEALGDGILAMVVSDHSPAPPGMKGLQAGDFLMAWGGIASLELRLAATWDGARRRGYGLADLAWWLTTAPADLAGLGHRKGRIAEGMDADLVVFDPEGITEVDTARLRQRHPISPYDGMRLVGAVVATFLRGRQVHGHGATPGQRGELLRRGV
jgi:allantoinase